MNNKKLTLIACAFLLLSLVGYYFYLDYQVTEATKAIGQAISRWGERVKKEKAEAQAKAIEKEKAEAQRKSAAAAFFHKHDHRCRIDIDDYRRSKNRPGTVIAIDRQKLAAPDPKVQKVINEITVEEITPLLRQLSGEDDFTPEGGKPVTIKTRSSYDPGVMVAMQFAEQFCKRESLSCKRWEYKEDGGRRARKMYNLEITIPGKVKTGPEKVLFIGAHLDSTAGEPWGQESLAPGADDDGSGVVAALLSARALSKLDLPYTVRVLLFTGEEQGLYGSTRYFETVGQDMKAGKLEAIAMLQMDMIAYTPNKGSTRIDVHDAADRNGSHVLAVAMVENAQRYGINRKPKDTHSSDWDERSDHKEALNQGIRSLLTSEEFTDESFYPYYHTTEDTIEKLNLEQMRDVARLHVAVVEDLMKRELAAHSKVRHFAIRKIKPVAIRKFRHAARAH
jgi:predicted glycoside hydrolase/deacetylase ChbG (UPF0249 family)